jgi:dynactin complex subunit
MNQRLKEVMIARYNAVIEDCKYKIKCYSDQEIIIPEHPDITLEIDKLLETMANAEEKLATIELHYGKNGTDKAIL